MSRNFSMQKIKAACNGMNAPFNHSFFAILSTALYEFNQRRGIKEDKMTLRSAFSMKPIITKASEMRSQTMICQTDSKLTFTDDLRTAVAKVPKPDIVGAYGSYYKAAITTSLPFDLGRYLLAKAKPMENIWFSYSSMPISMNQLIINGYKMTKYG